MTTWNTDAIINFVRQAKFTGIPLRQATAIVLATSSGNDAYYADVDVDGHGPWVGLFGIEDNATQNPKGVKLTDPVANARAAYRLWVGNGKTWDWSPQFASGGFRAYLSGVEDTLLLPSNPQAIDAMTPSTSADNARKSLRSVVSDANQTAVQIIGASSMLQ